MEGIRIGSIEKFRTIVLPHLGGCLAIHRVMHQSVMALLVFSLR